MFWVQGHIKANPEFWIFDLYFVVFYLFIMLLARTFQHRAASEIDLHPE